MKISQCTTPARGGAALATGLMAVPALLGASHPAASASAPAKTSASAAAKATGARSPELAVSVTDGRTAARPGDLLTYTVTVRDTGRAAAPHLTVTQALSPGLALVSASDHGRAAGGLVSWPADLPAAGSRTFHVVTRVTRTPPTLLRLSAVACVVLHGGSRPTVCAAHLDRLPAAAAAAAGSGSSRPATGVPGFAAAGGIAAVALGLLAAVAVRYRGLRRRRAD